MLPVLFTKSLGAASANSVALAQTLGAAGAVTLNGASVVAGVARLDTQRRVIITSAGDDSGVTFTVTGTNQAGMVITDSFPGAAIGAAQSNLDFLTVTGIRASGATSSITVGTNTTGSSQWFMPNYHLTPFVLDIESTVAGAVTYSIETTMDDFFTPPNQASVQWPAAGVIRVRPTSVVAATASQSLVINSPCRGWRLTITTGSGSVACEAMQAGIVNY
jgi:hypothetical protein